nr:MAG TPA: putative DNA double strand break repair [Caudoviricetes sp.]
MKNKIPYALLINDIHISKDNIPEFQKNWDEALQICIDRKIPEIIIGGDLWLSRSAQSLSVLMAARNAILKATHLNANLQVTIACGNHDKVDQEAFESYNHLFNEYDGVDVIDDYVIYDISDTATLYVMSYFPENGSFIQRFEDMAKDLDKSKFNVLYIHEGIRGGLAQASDDELPASIFSEFDSVLVGHYHDRKQIPDTNILYIGSSRQHNYGENEEKGYTVLYEDGSHEFIKNQANIRYKTIDVTPSSMTSDKFLNELSTYKDKNYRLRLRIQCKANEASTIDRQKLLDAGASRIEIVTEESSVKLTKSQSISTKFDKSGIKEEYRSFCHDKEIDNIDMGLQYLDKIR